MKYRPWRALALAAAILLMIILGKTLFFHAGDKWSLKNSWVPPYEAELKAFQKTLEQLENDPFFRLN